MHTVRDLHHPQGLARRHHFFDTHRWHGTSQPQSRRRLDVVVLRSTILSKFLQQVPLVSFNPLSPGICIHVHVTLPPSPLITASGHETPCATNELDSDQPHPGTDVTFSVTFFLLTTVHITDYHWDRHLYFVIHSYHAQTMTHTPPSDDSLLVHLLVVPAACDSD
jgi:hypothetical protein